MTRTPKAVAAYLSKIGKKGGEATTPAKQAAARANGAKGGRPKKQADPIWNRMAAQLGMTRAEHHKRKKAQ